MTAVPAQPKIYHIVHVDRLLSIITDGNLWCDAEVMRRSPAGTTIGMGKIKERRLVSPLTSHPNLSVGDCVPFYFCPRSIMLYLIYKRNHPELTYRDGQDPIIHLEADLHLSTEWAVRKKKRWAFTTSNAGNNYFEDRCDLSQLSEINWEAVQSSQWKDSAVKESKAAEFLMENSFPWCLIERIGVRTKSGYQQVVDVLSSGAHKPRTEIKPEWYY